MLRRGAAVCILNTCEVDTDLDEVVPGGRIVHASTSISGRRLPAYAAVWLLAPWPGGL